MTIQDCRVRAIGICLLSALLFTNCQPPPVRNTTTDANATTATKALHRNLLTVASKGTMFGHQDATLYGIGWNCETDRSDVKSVAGDYPAVYGWELGHIETGDSVSLDSMSFERIRQEAIKAHSRGGINSISWHLRNPHTGGSSWDVSDNQTVASILPGGSHHATYAAWLDRLAEYLNRFEDKEGTKIPLIFRPFHEHTGSWFWWGKNHCTPEQYKELFSMTVDYLRKTKHINHLLITYSPDRVYSEAEYFERYPGDDYVDILGIDWYHKPEMDTPQSFIDGVTQTALMIKKNAEARNKPFVFSETGLEKLPISDWFTQVLYPVLNAAKPAYVLVWRNAHERPDHFFAPYPGHESCDDFRLFKQKEDILFESELREMYQ